MSMRLGIGSYTYGWASGTYGWQMSRDIEHLSAADLIDRAARLGVEIAQVCVRPSLHEMSSEHLARLRRYAEERDIQLEIGTTGSDPDNLLAYLEIAGTLGATLVRTIFTDASPGLERERDRLAQIAPAYEREQIHLAIENHEMYGYRDLADTLAQLSCPYIGVCLDTVNSLGRGEGVEEVTAALLPFTACLHVKDYTVIRGDTDMGFTIVGTPAGDGKLDVPDQLARLREVNPQASVILEQWTPFAESIEHTIELQERWAEQSIAYLKQVRARLHSQRS